MKPIRLAIAGAGHLGRIHARLAATLPDFQIVAIADPMLEQATRVAAEHGGRAVADVRSVASEIDAALVVTPTCTHFEIAADLLARGCHVFVEKPLTPSASDATALVQLAEQRGCILQVGHVERFNPAFLAARPELHRPHHFRAVRRGCWTGRSTDVSVVLDLMIHDLDLVLSLVDGPPVSVTACGAPVVSAKDDWAEARVLFATGAVATFHVSRVHTQAERTLEMVDERGTVLLDFQAKTATRVAFAGRGSLPVSEPLTTSDNNAILVEQQEFAAAVRGAGEVTVSGRSGCAAVALAEHVQAEIAAYRLALGQRQREQRRRELGFIWTDPLRKAG